MKSTLQILSKFWGYTHFRPLQEDIIDSVINGQDVLAILPTGGGKSLCFQVPGIAREGMCIVVSPLIALMEDQVENLRKRGIRARAITSVMNYREIDITLDNAVYGGIDFLYISPERIQTTLFQERLKRMKVSLFAIDEAHCISEWGHDFRPAYQKIQLLREILPEVPMIALTATATEKVKEDIVSQLQLKKVEKYEQSFERPNLSYEVYQTKNKLISVSKICVNWSEFSGIVYCQTRRSVKEIVKYLQAQNVSVQMYHGGMNASERSNSLKTWMNGQRKVMVATNAFGMGIDKPDVRFVVHFEVPNNLEAFFQEAGRAGRDGNEARTFAFYENEDLAKLEQQLEIQFPSIEEIKRCYNAVCNFLKIAIGSGLNESYIFDYSAFCKSFQFDLAVCYASLRILESNGDIIFTENGLRGSRLKFALEHVNVYSFQLKNPTLAPLISFLNRLHGELFDNFQEIDEDKIVQTLKITQEELTNQLKTLEQNGIIEIQWRTHLPIITFCHERKPNDYLSLKPEVYLFRKEKAIIRLNSIKEYLQKDQCRQQFIIQYFGQTSEPCGKCDSCKRKKNDLSKVEIEKRILTFLTTNEGKKLIEICNYFPSENETSVKEVLKHLLLEERIVYLNELFYLRIG